MKTKAEREALAKIKANPLTKRVEITESDLFVEYPFGHEVWYLRVPLTDGLAAACDTALSRMAANLSVGATDGL